MLGLECTLDYIKHPQTRPHSGISNHTWKADVREWNAGNQRVACTVPQNKLAVSMGRTASTRGGAQGTSALTQLCPQYLQLDPFLPFVCL